MIYRVTKKYDKGREIEVGSHQTEHLAKEAIQKALTYDASIGDKKAIYSLYEGWDLIASFDQQLLTQDTPPSASSTESSQGSGKKQIFNPSPLRTAPRPGGIPPSSFQDEDEK